MAKPNVHIASRDELVEAGIRAELADEIVKLRRKGKVDLETLDEVPGVGPATLEQLRKSLDFRDQPKTGNDSGEPDGKHAAGEATEAGNRAVNKAREVGARAADQVAEVDKRTVDQAAEFSARATDQLTEAGKRTADQAAEVGKRTTVEVADVNRRAVEQTAEVTRELTDRTGDVVQQGLRVVQQTADGVRELPREVARQTTESTAEIGRTLLSLTHAQNQQNLNMMWALTAAVDWNKAIKAVDWDRVIQVQGAFVRDSLERSAQLTRRYLEISQTLMTAAASATRQQARRAG